MLHEAVVLGKTVILPTMFEACTLHVDTVPQPQTVPFRGGMGVVAVETVDLDGK